VSNNSAVSVRAYLDQHGFARYEVNVSPRTEPDPRGTDLAVDLLLAHEPVVFDSTGNGTPLQFAQPKSCAATGGKE
jgi:hypothetical protein